MVNPADALVHWTPQPAPRWPLAVAYSGGADSTALLIAAAQRWPGQVVALHVHHGLQAAADGFLDHCGATCAARGIALHTAHVDARPAAGDSPEDAARRARYTALARLADSAGCSDVLLAQHADDQVETLLLALSRGAGLPGLAAMPAVFERHGRRFHRPFLGLSAPGIRRWLADAGVDWITDPSNADTTLTRNRIRLQVLPALEGAFPQFRETMARSARHAAQAQALLEALAQQDLLEVGNPPALALLQTLPVGRQANLLRHWFKTAHDTAPSTAQLDELLSQLAACTTRGHHIRIKVGSGFVERRGAVLAWYNS